MSLVTPLEELSAMTAGKSESRVNLPHQESFWRSSVKYFFSFEQMYSTSMGGPCGRMLSSPVKYSNPTIISVPSEFFPAGHPRKQLNSIKVSHQWWATRRPGRRTKIKFKKPNLSLNCWGFFLPLPIASSSSTPWWRIYGWWPSLLTQSTGYLGRNNPHPMWKSAGWFLLTLSTFHHSGPGVREKRNAVWEVEVWVTLPHC